MKRPTERIAPFWSGTLLALVLSPLPSVAQDSNIEWPVVEIERLLTRLDFEVGEFRGARGLGDRTYVAMLHFEDTPSMQVKWAPAIAGGEEFNNRPRMEIAAYAIQRLFLDEDEYPVPPTVCRFVPIDRHPPTPPEAAPIEPTFKDSDQVLVVLQYWLSAVDQEADAKSVFDEERFERDPLYARHVANFNLLTYLIRHRDSNKGNFLASTDPDNPRVFSVDNGVAFSSEASKRGSYWEKIRVGALPQRAIDRLRAITPETLRQSLGVIEQFDVSEAGHVTPVFPTENLDPDEGIRHRASVVQLGLTTAEIRDVYARIQKLLEDVDRGKHRLF
jgi:hypothetical protein